MLGLSQRWRGSGEGAARLDQICRVELPPAVVTLIASGVSVTAMGARPFDVAVGEEAVGLGVVQLLADSGFDEAVLGQRRKDVLCDLAMVVGPGGRVEIPTDTERLPCLEELRVITVDDLLWAHVLLFGAHGDRRPVHVGSRDHQNLVSREPVIAGEDVGRQIGTGEMPEMAGA